MRDRLPWLYVVGAVLAIAGLALWMNLRFPPPKHEVIVKDGMVFIEAGEARLGDNPAKLRKFLGDYFEGKALDNRLKILARNPNRWYTSRPFGSISTRSPTPITPASSGKPTAPRRPTGQTAPFRPARKITPW